MNWLPEIDFGRSGMDRHIGSKGPSPNDAQKVYERLWLLALGVVVGRRSPQ